MGGGDCYTERQRGNMFKSGTGNKGEQRIKVKRGVQVHKDEMTEKHKKVERTKEGDTKNGDK